MEGRSRRTRPDIDLSLGEDAETTRQYGLYFLEHLEQARDKSGGLVAAEFLQLPDQIQYPDYYAQTAQPIAFDGIKSKLMLSQYPNIAALEADVKLLIFNAKHYYKKNSPTFNDAERVRKMLSDFVRKNLPRSGPNGSPITPRAFASGTPSGRSYQRKRKKDFDDETDELDEPSSKRMRTEDSSQDTDMNMDGTSDSIDDPIDDQTKWPGYASADFKGMSMQATQEKIVKECKALTDEDGDNFTAIFHNRPSRKYVDYYQLIKNPVSLNSVRKQVEGIQSRNEPTGRSAFKYWEDFEKEMELIWLNAREYNEDDSDVTKYSFLLEDFFKTRVKQAKRYVDDPPGPTMKLRLGKEAAPSAKITLALPQPTATPSPTPPAIIKQPSEPAPAPLSTPPILHPTLNGNIPSPPRIQHPAIARLTHRDVKRDRSQTPPKPQTPRNLAAFAPMTPAKHYPIPAPTPQPNNFLARPPATVSNPAAISPPTALTTTAPRDPSLFDPSGLPYGPDSILRRPTRTAADALIRSITLSSHPTLKLQPQSYNQLFLPSDRFSQLSHTVMLPAQISAVRATVVLGPEMGSRASKLVCSFEGRYLVPASGGSGGAAVAGAGTGVGDSGTVGAGAEGQGGQVAVPPTESREWEVRLKEGSNVLEFDALVANERGVPKRADTGDVDHEKVQFLVFLHGKSGLDGAK